MLKRNLNNQLNTSYITVNTLAINVIDGCRPSNELIMDTFQRGQKLVIYFIVGVILIVGHH